MENYDFIIVGAGSAGCVLANRLSVDPRNTVLLVEAGGDDRPFHNLRQFRANMMIHIPVGFSETMKNPNLNWGYVSQPEPGTNGRRHDLARGRVLGGCSSINGMVYVRGQAADYDHWRQLGATGWSWDDVLPYFRRAEHQERGEDAWHGIGGPLNVSSRGSEGLEVSRAVMRACEAIGIPERVDINGEDQEGIAWADVTMRKGRRHSTAVAYLHPAMRRPNLRVLTDTLVDRVLIENGRAVGIAFTTNGQKGEARANREVILSGGAFNSPQLLELSGIGSAERLKSLGIDVVVDSPEVGENLQDHILAVVTYRLKAGVKSVNEMTKGLSLVKQVLKYATTRGGLLGRSAVEMLLFARSRPELATPDIQMHITPATMKPGPNPSRLAADDFPGITFAPCQLRPESRGHVHISTTDPRVQPDILFNFLTAPEDRATLLAGMRMVRRIAAQPALADFIESETLPGAGVESDEHLMAFCRAAGTSLYHPVGTCRMGGDPGSVVDPELRVRGVEGLRVVDASIMPRLVSGNTNAPVIMIAEKAADMILGSSTASAAKELVHG